MGALFVPDPGDGEVYALTHLLANAARLGPILGEKAIKQDHICGYLFYITALHVIGAFGSGNQQAENKGANRRHQTGAEPDDVS